jgi:diaminohydroxyphosphoribosylaminopyrimidine deaminase/5-amino-6-(5-phosphoribosylamino)uracil reductase
LSSQNKIHLLAALRLAEIRRGFCAPNPAVGAVIVNQMGDVLATGYHQGPGLPHAEIDALNKLTQIPDNVTILVTLEPCCHYGKTPPCTDTIIQSGIKRIVYSYRDPNPIVFGKGESALRSAGILCEYFPLQEVNDFYESYYHWHTTKIPFITAKIALSLDGKISGKNSEPIQLTGQQINEFTHQQRKIHDAILTTAKTIHLDDPQLNARVDDEIIAKPIYILDSKLTLLPKARILSTAKNITVFHARNIAEEKKHILIALGVRCIPIDEEEDGLDLHQIIKFIGKDGIHDLWIEAGGECFSNLLKQKLLQRAFIYIAPRLVSEGKIGFDSKFQFDFSSHDIRWQQIGKDMLCEIQFK